MDTEKVSVALRTTYYETDAPNSNQANPLVNDRQKIKSALVIGAAPRTAQTQPTTTGAAVAISTTTAGRYALSVNAKSKNKF